MSEATTEPQPLPLQNVFAVKDGIVNYDAIKYGKRV